MDEFSKQLASLSPEQRALLELRLKKKGLSVPIHLGTSEIAGVARTEIDVRDKEASEVPQGRPANNGMQFSIIYFSGDGSKGSRDKYKLVIESAKFADQHGFSAVWIPERHFQDFGGLYPNPSVLGAALAMVTERIQIRAGSVVLPLHNPIRVAEEWAVVDNLSGGRVGISFASGWYPIDFALSPDRYECRKEVMFREIQTVQRLWTGGSVTVRSIGGNDVEVRILPRPLQPTLPIWVTSSDNPETWIKAGEIGANMLTALMNLSVDDLAERIALYRASLAKHGRDPHAGSVTVMLHTFVGEDLASVREKVEGPLRSYLRTFTKQHESLMAHVDLDILISRAFERYFNTSSLLGTPSKCAQMVDSLKEMDVDEVACLIDFGLDSDLVMEGLRRLSKLKDHYKT